MMIAWASGKLYEQGKISIQAERSRKIENFHKRTAPSPLCLCISAVSNSLSPILSLSLSLFLSFSLSLPLSFSLFLFLSLPFSLSHSLSHYLFLSFFFSLSRSLSHSLSHYLFLSFSFSLSRSLSLTLSPTIFFSLSLSLSPVLSLSLPLYLSLFLSPPLSHSTHTNISGNKRKKKKQIIFLYTSVIISLLYTTIEPWQVLTLWARVELRVMAMKSAPHSPDLQNWSLAIKYILVSYPRHSFFEGGFTFLAGDTVSLF